MHVICRLLFGLAVITAMDANGPGTSGPTGETSQPSNPATRSKDTQFAALIAENNDAFAALVDLAVERFKLNSHLGAHWIMATQDADNEVRKYTDGKFTVVAVPLYGPGENPGLRRFVSAYNQMVIRDADMRVLAGDVKAAEAVYRLLLKHDPSSSYANGLHTRLQYLEDLKTSGNTERLRKQFQELRPQYDMFSFISDMGLRSAITVTNLLDVDVNATAKPESERPVAK